MGGTSLDVCLIKDGQPCTALETAVAGVYHLKLPLIDVHTIGAGGGSIAWLDPGRLVHVGPTSAGAFPGPACYMRGGEEPTVTDANVVLGYLDPDYFLGGRMKIDSRLSAQVIEDKIAKPLDLDLMEAAYTVWTTVNHNMVAAIEDITIWQGVDPREYLLIAGGGAAGLHIVPIAQELKMKKIIVPKLSGVLSSVGGLAADMTMDFHASHLTDSERFDYEGVNRCLKDLEVQARDFLLRTRIADEKTEISFYVEARYAYQVWDLNVVLKGNRIEGKDDIDRLVEDFHNAHERIFEIKEPCSIL